MFSKLPDAPDLSSPNPNKKKTLPSVWLPFMKLAQQRKFNDLACILRSGDANDLLEWLSEPTNPSQNSPTANKNAIDVFRGETLLHCVMMYRPTMEVVDLLIGRMKQFQLYGNDIENPEEAIDVQGRTPLHIAAANGCDLTVIQRLMCNQRSLQTADVMNRYPLHWACSNPQRFNLSSQHNMETSSSALCSVSSHGNSNNKSRVGWGRMSLPPLASLSPIAHQSQSSSIGVKSVSKKEDQTMMMQIIATLVWVYPAAVSSRDIHGKTPLDLATENGAGIAVIRLLESVAQIGIDKIDLHGTSSHGSNLTSSSHHSSNHPRSTGMSVVSHDNESLSCASGSMVECQLNRTNDEIHLSPKISSHSPPRQNQQQEQEFSCFQVITPYFPCKNNYPASSGGSTVQTQDSTQCTSSSFSDLTPTKQMMQRKLSIGSTSPSSISFASSARPPSSASSTTQSTSSASSRLLREAFEAVNAASSSPIIYPSRNGKPPFKSPNQSFNSIPRYTAAPQSGCNNGHREVTISRHDGGGGGDDVAASTAVEQIHHNNSELAQRHNKMNDGNNDWAEKVKQVFTSKMANEGESEFEDALMALPTIIVRHNIGYGDEYDDDCSSIGCFSVNMNMLRERSAANGSAHWESTTTPVYTPTGANIVEEEYEDNDEQTNDSKMVDTNFETGATGSIECDELIDPGTLQSGELEGYEIMESYNQTFTSPRKSHLKNNKYRKRRPTTSGAHCDVLPDLIRMEI